MSEEINVPAFSFKFKRIHGLLTLGGAVLGLAFGAGAQVALSKATIESHESRLAVVEAAASKAATAVIDLASKTEVHEAKRDQQLDDLERTVHHIEYLLDHGKR